MTLEQQLVWVREGSEGFVLARLHELLGEEADVVPLDSKHARRVASFDDILPAGDPDKEVDDNCKLIQDTLKLFIGTQDMFASESLHGREESLG